MTKLCVIGGFLGAGKTTAILELAKQLIAENKTVGIVTNDQGSDLVDTNYLKAHGFSVVEVAGGCFCCNFEEFTMRLNALQGGDIADVILAEPVGSCTDLVASIFRPLQIKHSSQFSLCPLCVVVDPKRARRLMMEQNGGFESEINYLFKKQVEEADILYVNKSDLYSKAEMDEIAQFLAKEFKTASIVVGNKDDCPKQLLPLLLGAEHVSRELMELDYDTYGRAEGFLGWYNGTATVLGESPVRLKQYCSCFMNKISKAVREERKEIAHLKVYAVSSAGFIKTSMCFADSEPEYSGSDNETSRASVVINARINMEPHQLSKVVEQAFLETLQELHLQSNDFKSDCFAPAPPTCNRS